MRETGNMNFGIFTAPVAVSLVSCSENCCWSKGKYLSLLPAGAGVTLKVDCVGNVKTERVS